MSTFEPAAALTAAGAGDRRAWESIVTAYSGLVWSVARGYRLSSADAADVYQGTWLRLVEHLADIRDGAALGSWLATTARREALTLLRRGRRLVTIEDVEAIADEGTGPGESHDDRLIRGEQERALWTAFDGLAGRCQRLLRLVFADPPLAYEIIGEMLGMPVGSIGPTRARCLDTLRSHLTEAEAGA